MVAIEDIVNYFIDFYERRKRNGLPDEKKLEENFWRKILRNIRK